MKDTLTPVVDMPKNWEDMPLHELCTLFPQMQDEEYESLVASMTSQGFLPSDPIILIDVTPDAPDCQYEILDGRNRQLAAIDSGTKPEFMCYNGDNPVGFVTGRNLDRRHLSTGQKAAIAASLTNLMSGQNAKNGEMTQAEAADQIGVGEVSIRRFKYVEKHDPELAAQIKEGSMPLEKARAIIKEKLNPQVDQPIDPGLELPPLPPILAETAEPTFSDIINDTCEKYCTKEGITDHNTKIHIKSAILIGYELGVKK